MKIWMVLPADYMDQEWDTQRTFFRVSTAAMCPPKTLEMQQDNLEWFEAEVLRPMTNEKTRVKRSYEFA